MRRRSPAARWRSGSSIQTPCAADGAATSPRSGQRLRLQAAEAHRVDAGRAARVLATAANFVTHAVARRKVEQAYDLAAPSLRGGLDPRPMAHRDDPGRALPGRGGALEARVLGRGRDRAPGPAHADGEVSPATRALQYGACTGRQGHQAAVPRHVMGAERHGRRRCAGTGVGRYRWPAGPRLRLRRAGSPRQPLAGRCRSCSWRSFRWSSSASSSATGAAAVARLPYASAVPPRELPELRR